MIRESMKDAFRNAGANMCDQVRSMFLSGDCDHLSAENVEMWIEMARPIKYFSTEEAIAYTKYKQATFYNYKLAGLISDPIKLNGYLRPVYVRRKLDEEMAKIKSMSSGEIRKAILNAKSKAAREKNKNK